MANIDQAFGLRPIAKRLNVPLEEYAKHVKEGA